MSKRVIHIKGLPRTEQPRPDPAKKGRRSGRAPEGISADDYDYQCNILRRSGEVVRFRNDYWQPMAHKVVFSLTGKAHSYAQIVPTRSLLPDGCGTLWLIEPRDSSVLEDDPNRVWAIIARQSSGAQISMFIRAGLFEIDRQMLPVDNLTQIISQNVRPLNKIRFAGTGDDGYFTPERNFCYIGHQYR